MTDRFPRLLAHGRQEAHEESSSAVRPTCPEGISEEVEAGVLRGSSTLAIFAVDDLRLVGVQFEAESPEPGSDGSPKILGLFLSVAVGQDVVCSCRVSNYAEDWPNLQ